MRIAIIAHNLRSGGGISVGQNIISSLGRIAPENQYLITVPSSLGYEGIASNVPNCEVIVFKMRRGYYLRRGLFEYLTLPKICNNWNPDVILGLGNAGLHGNSSIPQAILCHNPFLLYERRHYGQTYGLTDRLLLRFLKRPRFAKDVSNSKIVFCQTHTAEKRIRQVYDFQGKCLQLPNAVSFLTHSGENNDSVPDILQPHQNKFRLFYLTKYYSHKNIEVLLELFDRYSKELSDVVVFLTIAKEHGRGAAKLLQTIDRKGLNDRIINVGPLSQESLGAYFRNMDALIMPTLLESFSGSYLEAMHFGLPILTSDLDFAREVCGEAAIYFDPWDVETIKDAILKLKNSPKLTQYLISAGKTQLQSKFQSWDDITKRLLKNLQEIVAVK